MIACMKGFSSFGAILIFIVGLGMSAITIYGYSHAEIFLDDTDSKDTILGIMGASCAIILISSLMGMCGLKKGNVCLILIFQLTVIVFLVVFFSLGVAAEILPQQFFNGNCTDSDNPTIQKALNVFQISNDLFCKDGCPCRMTDDALA